ncbi:MAG: hypothetical protein DMG81_10715 [Acidobacteria bacterium]|nr:MAG: hypothetical protein DMG81_10715 [Acidobacteriota bacterium]
MTGLKVVWRNKKATPRARRWHPLARDVGRRLYVVEELVIQGDLKRWAQSIALEVISGKRPLAQSPSVPKSPKLYDVKAHKLTV